MDGYKDTIKKWDEAARSPGARAAIHPSGGIDEEAYELSGFMAARKVLRTLPPEKFSSIIDYGCGDGRVLRHLAGRYAFPYGFDTSSAMREACSAAAPRAVVLSSVDGLFTNYETGVFSFAVFIHHTFIAGAAMLRDLAVACPNATFALQIPLYEVAREPTSWTDVGVWTLPMLEQAADLAGLRVERAYVSPGEFTYDRIGHAHSELQVLTRKP
jgi:trans-aconitate methyltransferase